MKIILLSGGSGKRLWPLSNGTRSKQFLKLLKNEEGQYESMIQRIYRQIRTVLPQADILVTTSGNQRDSVISHLGEKVQILLEPQRRDTFPAILLASAYLAFEQRINLAEPVVVLPVDPYTELSYFEAVEEMGKLVAEEGCNLALLGIKPTYPSEKYGYILPKKETIGGKAYPVDSFCEKPDLEKAKQLIDSGAVWNGGVFAFQLKYMVDILQQHIETDNFQTVLLNYGVFEQTSFDYAVVEKEPSIVMVPYCGYWKDLGTWNTLTEEMDFHTIGEVMTGEEEENTYVINELGIPIVALGTKNMVVAASPDGILISDLGKSAYMKPYVEHLGKRPMYEERRWGSYKVLDFIQYENGLYSLTKHLTVVNGCFLSYQSHALRDEIWTIVDGTADLLLDGHIRNVRPGDVAYISKGQKHSIRATSTLHFIEVQLGEHLVEDDITRYRWSWGDKNT